MGAPFHVLFVCTGNTCRSPLAEGMFRKALGERSDFEVTSAGVAALPGASAAPHVLTVLAERGIKLHDFRSRPVTGDLIARATHIFAMTAGHLATLARMFPEAADRLYLTCEFADIPGMGIGCDVPDPIGCGLAAYQEVARIFDVAIPSIIAYIDQTTKS